MNDNQIKPSQYMFLITGFVSGSILLVSFLQAKHDTWIISLLALVVILPLIACYVYLYKKFPGKNLIEIFDIVYGRILGKVFSILYIFFFWTLLTLNLRDVSIFYTGFVMPESPQIVFLIAFALLCGYAVKKGVPAIAKVNLVLVVLVFFVVTLTFLLLLDKMDFENFLPVLETPAKLIYQSTQTMSMVPYGEIFVFIMIMPFVDTDKKLAKYSMGGITIAALIFLLLTVRNTAVLGSSATIYTQPSYQSVRLINIGEFFSRVEILIALNNTSMMFIKISVLYYATVKSLAQVFSLKDYKPLIIPVGIIAIIYAMIAFPSEVAHQYWGSHFASVFEVPFVLILPLLTLLVAAIRRLPGKKRSAHQNCSVSE